MDLGTLGELAAIADPIERARAIDRASATLQGLSMELAQMKADAVAEAHATLSGEAIANALGVTPGRVSQLKSKATGMGRPNVVVARALPTEPSVRAGKSLFLSEAERQGLRPDRRMLYVGAEAAPDEVAGALRIESGADALVRRKLMTADDVPVRLASSWFRLDLFGGTRISEGEFVLPSLQACLEKLGYRFGRAEETLTARPATATEADTLALGPGEWVVQVLRASYDTTDNPVHILETICAASRHVFPIGQLAGGDEF